MIAIQRAMIKGSQKVICCLEHTKSGRRSVLALCDREDAGLNGRLSWELNRVMLLARNGGESQDLRDHEPG